MDQDRCTVKVTATAVETNTVGWSTSIPFARNVEDVRRDEKERKETRGRSTKRRHDDDDDDGGGDDENVIVRGEERARVLRVDGEMTAHPYRLRGPAMGAHRSGTARVLSVTKRPHAGDRWSRFAHGICAVV